MSLDKVLNVEGDSTIAKVDCLVSLKEAVQGRRRFRRKGKVLGVAFCRDILRSDLGKLGVQTVKGDQQVVRKYFLVFGITLFF